MDSHKNHNILLILDIDETLIHASEVSLGYPADFMAYQYHIYRRPFLDDFIVKVSKNFDLAVWSSASDDYVKFIVSNIFPDPTKLKFVWGRSRATFKRFLNHEQDTRYFTHAHQEYIKPLSKVKKKGWELSKMLIVDDTPRKCIQNYGNAIYPSPFEGQRDDDELVWLAKYLETLKHVDNVRSIEKRRWRENISKL